MRSLLDGRRALGAVTRAAAFLVLVPLARWNLGRAATEPTSNVP